MSVDTEHLSQLLTRARIIELPAECPLVILDTNVLLDILLFKDAKVRMIREALQKGQLIAVGHFDSFYEFADVLARPLFKLTADELNKLLHSWIRIHRLYPHELKTESFCRDRDDDKFFNLAKAVGAKFLISKDKKVLKAKGKAKQFGCLVINPEQLG